MEVGELSGSQSPQYLKIWNPSQKSHLQCPTSRCGYGRNVACHFFNHTTPHVHPPHDRSQVFALRFHRPLSTRKHSTCAPASVGEALFHSPVCRSIGRKACSPSELVLAKPFAHDLARLHLYRGFQPGATSSVPALRESFSGHDLELDAVLDDPQIGEEN